MKGAPDPPDVLNRIVDVVLAYKPKPKTVAAKKRVRKGMVLGKKGKPIEEK